MGFVSENYAIDQTTPLVTDKYHFTTAYAYWLEGRADNPAVFYMFGRKEALGAGYTVAAGLEGVIDIVKRWQQFGFSDDDLHYLSSLKTKSGQRQFPDDFIDYLSKMDFKLKIDAAPEGSDLTLASSALPSGGWRCRLHNGGAAIPADVLPHVFEIFFSTA